MITFYSIFLTNKFLLTPQKEEKKSRKRAYRKKNQINFFLLQDFYAAMLLITVVVARREEASKSLLLPFCVSLKYAYRLYMKVNIIMKKKLKHWQQKWKLLPRFCTSMILSINISIVSDTQSYGVECIWRIIFFVAML